MTDTPLAAIIGAVGAVVGASIPVVSSWYSDRRYLSPISKWREKALCDGAWKGSGIDIDVESGAAVMEFTARMSFNIRSRKVLGTAVIGNEKQDVELTLSGGFYNDDFLQLNYKSKYLARKQMGVVVLVLSNEVDELTGHYAGFSPVRNTFVVGKCKLRKITP